ncbi:hypothetical protein JB92DRAFT_3101061 [Gautieria morchelliformis]|nr:hypothetical protein JB92DRAFT_3101061 [Gautieria morchelliformis]
MGDKLGGSDEQVGTGAIATGKAINGSIQRQTPIGNKTRRVGHVGETVVNRSRASDTQSRQNKGQDNATGCRRAGAGGRGLTQRQEDWKNGFNVMQRKKTAQSRPRTQRSFKQCLTKRPELKKDRGEMQQERRTRHAGPAVSCSPGETAAE